jgi:hypothetical protein
MGTEAPAPRLLIKTFCTHEHAGCDGCDYILIDVAALRDRLRELRELVAPLFKEKSFYAASFFDYGFDSVDCGDLEEFDWFDPDEDSIVVPDGVQIAESEFRVDSPTVRIMSTGVLWTFYEKYTGLRFESQEVDWDTLLGQTEAAGA